MTDKIKKHYLFLHFFFKSVISTNFVIIHSSMSFYIFKLFEEFTICILLILYFHCINMCFKSAIFPFKVFNFPVQLLSCLLSFNKIYFFSVEFSFEEHVEHIRAKLAPTALKLTGASPQLASNRHKFSASGRTFRFVPIRGQLGRSTG